MKRPLNDFGCAVGENLTGATGACNRYAYSFTDVTLARAAGGNWRPLTGSSVLEDPGYRLLQTSGAPSSFVAASVDAPVVPLSR